jgi:hypothetical protein
VNVSEPFNAAGLNIDVSQSSDRVNPYDFSTVSERVNVSDGSGVKVFVGNRDFVGDGGIDGERVRRTNVLRFRVTSDVFESP